MSDYLRLDDLWPLMFDNEPLRKLYNDYRERMSKAPGSSHNHQAWVGGYLDHVVETMNIAVHLYVSSPREFPFVLSDALVVMLLHDLEKPWKYSDDPSRWTDSLSPNPSLRTKQERKDFRTWMIKEYKINLTADQWNALKYVEGVPDSEYTPGERTMGELAAFCHCCDILSARLWHDRGRGGAW